MNKRHFALTIIMCFGLLCCTLVRQALGAQKTTKEQASPLVAGKSLKPADQIQKSARVGLSTETQRATKAVQTSPKHKSLIELRPMTSKRGLQAKVRKKVTPKAVVQPRMDLIHYGVLEDSQRYDPRPHAASAGVPSPQTPELTHDHFQELDRNQDGMIDPVERAFGRIDMDRDLHTRTLQ